MVSRKHLPEAVCILLLHLIAFQRCSWTWNHRGGKFVNSTKKKKTKNQSLSLIVCFDLCAFAGTIVSCKPIFSSQIWDIYVNSYICCSWAAANAEHSLSFVSDTASVRQGTWQSGYLPPFAVSNILLLQHQLCAGFSTLLSSQCKYYEQRYSPWTTPERLIWDAFPFLFGLSFFPIVLSVCLYVVYLFIYLFLHTQTYMLQ